MASDDRIMIDLLSDSGESELSSPRTWFETPRNSPVPSAITTPETSATERSLKAPSNPVSNRFEYGLPLQTKPSRNQTSSPQGDTLEEIESRRSNFFAAIKSVIIPILGDSAFSDEVAGDAEIQSYVPLQSQPARLRAALKPYQLEGLSWLLYLRNNGVGGILADDMGLGKTLQTLALFQYVSDGEFSRDHRFLVICPLSVMNTWISEAQRWTTGLRTMAYHGSTEERESLRRLVRQVTENPINIVVTSYETLCSDVWWFRRFCTWSYVVLDEGHRIKNHSCKRAQGIQKIRSEYKLVLSGTPIQNDLTELWSILHWLYPDLFILSTADAFEDSFNLSEGKFDSRFIDHLKQFLKLVMLRRTKDCPDIGLNVPPKQEILAGVDKALLEVPEQSKQLQHPSVTPSTENYIDLTMDECETQGPVDVRKRSKITTNILMELRKCSIHPYLLEDAIPEDYMLGEHIVHNSRKFVVLQKMVHQFVVLEGKKVIIFSGFEQALNLCEDLLEMEKVHMQFKHVRLDGSTTNAWRNLSVFLFQNDPAYKVFLISIRAGGEGINLVSSSTVVFLDEDWNPQVMRQAESRVHRIGQSKPVSIFRLHAKGTVEEQMRRRLSKKAYLANMVMDENEHTSMPSPTALRFASDRDLLLLPGGDIIPNDLNSEMLSKADFRTIMQTCEVSDTDIQAMTDRDRKAWLEGRERVKTNIFNGHRVDTSSRSFSVYTQTTLETPREGRRIGKERITYIDGYPVVKANFESTVASSPKPKDTSDKITHEDVCFICRGCDALACESCPRRFHEVCLASTDLQYTVNSTTLICPHHYCCECGKTASKVGRLLYCCLNCECAFCEQCLNWTATVFVGENKEAEAHGYFPKSAFYVRCATCSVDGQTPHQKQKRHFETPVNSRKRARHG